MGCLHDLYYTVTDTVEFLRDLGEFTADSFKDIGEAWENVVECTAGVGVRLLVHGDADYTTSYDIRDEARDIVRESREKLEAKQEEAEERFAVAEESYARLAKREQALLRTLDGGMQAAGISRKPLPFRYVWKPSCGSAFDIGTNIGLLGTGLRRAAAEDYLEKAKDYRTEVRRECARLGTVLSNLGALSCSMREEEGLLDALQRAVNAGRLDRSAAGALLIDVIGTPVCGTSGKPSAAYRRRLEQLRAAV